MFSTHVILSLRSYPRRTPELPVPAASAAEGIQGTTPISPAPIVRPARGLVAFHGSAFEFLRNTDLDARGYFSPERSTFQQNQYGGTFGGPIKKGKLFFFGDYQGQRTVEGIGTGIVSVPSLLNRTGVFDSSVPFRASNNLNGSPIASTVDGSYLAGILAGELEYQPGAVTSGEPYYYTASTINPATITPTNPAGTSFGANCTSNNPTTGCVFPNATIPQRAFAGLPAAKMLQFIPSPNVGTDQFSSGAEKRRTHDDKGSARIDATSAKYGNFSAYYFIDCYNLDDPYPVGLAAPPSPARPAPTMHSRMARTRSLSFGTQKRSAPPWSTRRTSATRV